MSDNTDLENEGSEENQLIRDMRDKLKAAEARAKTAAEDTRAEITRENSAIALLGDSFKELAPYFAGEVEGDLTADAAAEWLKAKGLAASSSSDKEDSKEDAEGIVEGLEDVTNLGSAVAAAASVTAESSFNDKLNEATEGLHDIGDLPAVTARLSAILEQ